MMNRNRRGFTIVELLVVISIIGMMLAMLVPALSAARALARKTQCMTNERGAGQALITQSTIKGYYPGRVSELVISNPVTGQIVSVAQATWVMQALPELDKTAMMDDLLAGRLQNAGAFISEVICPSDRPPSTNSPELSFVVNAGILDIENDIGFGLDSPANGVCHDMRLRTLNPNDDLKRRSFLQQRNKAMQVPVNTRDGNTQTILLSENVDAGVWFDQSWLTGTNGPQEIDHGFVWNQDVDAMFRINIKAGDRRQGDYDVRYARPSSKHSGGVNVIFCDGHSTFLREDISHAVLVQLMTPDGRKAGVDPKMVSGTIRVTPLVFPSLTEADYN
jgi:prepilin-type N-terminal cleavage/methylation domain-containing protein/prepilin-type processing-associated H-X9-DG protein